MGVPMPDMLVKLYGLPELQPELIKLKAIGIEIRPGHPAETEVLAAWVRRHFSESWASACEIALRTLPARCFIAVELGAVPRNRTHDYELPAETLLGFACYDAVARGMFGPLGIRGDRRGNGVGKALLLSCLHRMASEGYAYAIVGWAGPIEFYECTVSATVIEGSEPGIYRGPLEGVD
jgi:GNAT superfamily N-acetyltransferase